MLGVVVGEFIAKGVVPADKLIPHLADNAQAEDARTSGVAAEFVRHLVDHLRSIDYDTAPLLASEHLAKIPRWEDQKERLA